MINNQWLNLFFLFCIPLSAMADFNVMTLNAEWLWTPYDHRVDGQKINKGDMTPQNYDQELQFYADILRKNKVSVLAINEIENKQVAQELANKIGPSWKPYFKQGLDTATGQDVAILSNLPPVLGSETDFDFPYGSIKGSSKKKRLSKVLGVQFWITKGMIKGKPRSKLGIITAHFLSKRHESKTKSENRQRQAVALVKAVKEFSRGVDALIVMGDFNDFLSSPALTILIERTGLKPIKGLSNKWRIDHILYQGLDFEHSEWVNLEHYSDHNAILASFN